MTVPMPETASERLAYRRQSHADDEPLVWAQPGDGDGYALWYDCGMDRRRLTADALREVRRLFELYSAAPVTAWPRFGTVAGLDEEELEAVAERLAPMLRNPGNTFVVQKPAEGGLEP